MVVQLDEELWFPDPHVGDPDGMLAVGGDLSIDRLLLAYSHGIFPWFSFRDGDEPIWYCPMERFVIFPSEVHVSHSMRTLINKRRYGCSFNQDFHGVITQCSQLRIHEQGAWLGENMIKAYEELYRAGLCLERGSVGHGRRQKARGGIVWSYHRQERIWRKYVLLSSQCLEAGTHLSCQKDAWPRHHRLPV